MPERSPLPRLGPRGEGWVLAQLGLFAVVAATGLAGPRWTDDWRMPALGAGLVLGGLGASLMIAGVRSLGSSLTPMPVPNADSELKMGGAYALVRHPIYGGVLLLALAWALLLSPWALVPAVVVALFFSLKARLEESYLVHRYGDEYRKYERRVRHRFLPYVW
jgi:protein-S-isoprenylcysteine O-methyltransferase Ste14